MQRVSVCGRCASREWCAGALDALEGWIAYGNDLFTTAPGGHSARGCETLLELDGATLTVRDALEVSCRGRTVRLSERAAEAVGASLRLKRELIAEEIPIYGVTTGFGDSAHRQISPAKTAKLQQNILRFMGCGTGPTAPPEVARVTMLLRANCLSKGNSGVRVELIEQLLDLLNNDVLPFIPERGSCGASGDLAPLSYVGRAMAGDGRVRFDGVERDAAEVLAELGLEPFLLEAKEGLALTNGTSFMSAFACLAVGATKELADLADLMTAMASEALCGNRGHFDSFLFDDAKPHPGMVTSARNIRELLADSRLALDSDELFRGGMEGAHFGGGGRGGGGGGGRGGGGGGGRGGGGAGVGWGRGCGEEGTGTGRQGGGGGAGHRGGAAGGWWGGGRGAVRPRTSARARARDQDEEEVERGGRRGGGWGEGRGGEGGAGGGCEGGCGCG